MRWDRDYKNPEVINDPTIIPAYGVTDEERARWNAKQDALKYDPEPTPYSDNHMISGAIYNALEQYKLTTTQLCQAFFWGQVGGLSQIKDACEGYASNANSSALDAAAYAQASESSKDEATLQAGYASGYATAASQSATNANGSKEAAAGSAAAAAQAVLDAQQNEYDAEAWAVGERNGVPVSSDDPTYHNNSKYYADLGSEVIQDDETSLYTTWSSNKISGIFGLKADLENGKVPAAQLPSYVDDVIEGYYNTTDHKFYEESTYTTEITGESDKLYVSLDTNKTYRWSGSAFVEVSESLALGETSSTAYAGDKGKQNADNITTIQGLIPSDATTINQLATAGDIPTALSALSDDATHRLVTDTEKSSWDSKAPGSHTHDDRYYTETEIDNKFNGVTFTTVDDDIYINW